MDTGTPGFRIRPYQVEEANPNDNDWTEEMLQGLHGENKADTFGLDAEGFMDWLDVIDFKNDSGGSGNFTLDYPLSMVNIPGPDMGSEDNCALEIIGYIEFPQAGMYTMGVNSDDGFRVQTYTNPRDAFAVRVGEYNGGRGASDTTFKIYIPEAGIYPFRLVWENRGGGAAVEFYIAQVVDDVAVGGTGQAKEEEEQHGADVTQIEPAACQPNVEQDGDVLPD